MSRLNFSRVRGPGDLSGHGDPQNEPESTGSVLDCPNETGTWLAENMAEPIQTGAIEIIGDYLTSYRDRFAQAKALRELLALADRCEDAIRKTEAA